METRHASGWEALAATAHPGFADARGQIHWAVQVLAAAARQLLDPRPDDSHTALAWEGHRLVTEQFTDGRRLALTPGSLVLSVLRPDGSPDEELPLAGARLGDGMRWASERVAGGWGLRLPDYDVPHHPVRSGAPFDRGDLPAHRELARWYRNAAALLDAMAAAEPAASPVLCWPHHFDIATLVALDPPGSDREAARSVGLGLSPGDGEIPEPYFYVLPWPRPEDGARPSLPRGHWHSGGFVGAILSGPELAREQGAAAQAAAAREFLEAGLAGARAILGAA